MVSIKTKKTKELLLRFWNSEDNKISLIRDVLVALLIVFIILIALWTYTGQWFSAPMVAIKSGSMMHPDEPFGRLGTIDAGDMVLLVKVYSRDDIVPRGSTLKGALAEKDKNNFYYGDYGDVIIYHPYGDLDRDQIIHRAICWVEYNEKYDTYTVEDYNLINVTSITIPELGLHNYVPPHPHSGFITKGDNPFTNHDCDQTSPYICEDLIKMEWISGKARGEIPWIGTINLLFNDFFTGKNTLKNVPSDSIICLIILIAFLISIPVSMDVYSYYKEKKKQTTHSKKSEKNNNNN